MSDERLRLFVAADIPREVREVIASTLHVLRGQGTGVRLVRPENLHLTLKFIGEHKKEGLDRLSNEVRTAAGRCAAFEAALGGCGVFPTRRKARVFWVGMSCGVEEAAAIARKLDARLEKAGVKREERPFRGHLTLARFKQPRDCTTVLEDMAVRLEGLRGMPFQVEEIVLYRSILEPQGPTYISMERMALGGARGEED